MAISPDSEFSRFDGLPTVFQGSNGVSNPLELQLHPIFYFTPPSHTPWVARYFLEEKSYLNNSKKIKILFVLVENFF